MSAALVVPGNPESWTSSQRRLGVAYALGAVDAISQRDGLSELEAIGVHVGLCVELFGDIPDVVAIAAQVATEATPQELVAIQRGGQGIIDWVSGKDRYSPLDLVELLHSVDDGVRNR